MMSLLYATPKTGKTLAALAAFPDAAIATTKIEAVIEPCQLYGIDIPEDRIAVVKSVDELKAFVKQHKDRPLIIDDLSDLLEMELKACERAGFVEHESYGELNNRFIPFIKAVSKNAKNPVIITAWVRESRHQKDVAGDKDLVKATWAAPGGVMRSTVPGLCDHVLFIEDQEPPTSPWPFVFRCRPSKLATGSCRAPASVPDTLPLALSAIYRATGYECQPLFDAQPKVREAAYKALTNPNRQKGEESMSKMFAKLESEGVNLYAAGYAVVEAQVQLALERHAANLAENLAGSFF